MAVIKLMKST